jgi:hypothetical protein
MNDVAALVAASRAAQGLPPTVEDEETLLQAAGRLLAAQTPDMQKAASPPR